MFMYYIFATILFFETAKSDCGVVSKQEWNGLSPVHVEYLPRPVDLVIIQHTMTTTCFIDDKCAEIIRGIQNNKMDNFGDWDIGTNFIVGGNGKIYEGTGWLHVGGHIRGYSDRAIEITFVGNFITDTPTTQSLEAVKDLLRCGVERGHLASNYHVVGHRQLVAIESPGRNLYNEIKKWPQWLENVRSLKKRT